MKLKIEDKLYQQKMSKIVMIEKRITLFKVNKKKAWIREESKAIKKNILDIKDF